MRRTLLALAVMALLGTACERNTGEIGLDFVDQNRFQDQNMISVRGSTIRFNRYSKHWGTNEKKLKAAIKKVLGIDVDRL